MQIRFVMFPKIKCYQTLSIDNLEKYMCLYQKLYITQLIYCQNLKKDIILITYY